MTGKSLLGTRLKQAREAQEMTQEDLAARLGIHRNTLSRYERGELGISTDLLVTIARLLKRPVSWFLSEETEDEAEAGRSVIPQLIRQLEERYQEMDLIDVPLLGTVPAGEPVTPEEQPRERISVPREEIKSVRHPPTFTLH